MSDENKKKTKKGKSLSASVVTLKNNINKIKKKQVDNESKSDTS
jgi:hypothetical protein